MIHEKFTIRSRISAPHCSTWNKFIRLTVLLLLLAVVLVGCNSPKPSNELIVGMDLSYPPFETIDSAGKPIGVSVELAKALAASLERPLRIENMPFQSLIPSLQNKRIDCVISSMTETEERKKSIAFSDPYLSTGLAMLVRKDSPLTSAQDADQTGKTIVVRQGTTGEVLARQTISKAKLLAVEKENAAVMEVIQGRADGFIYDQMSVWLNAQKNPDTTKALLAPIRKEEWAVGLRKDDIALREGVNRFLKDFRAQGGFERLGDQFLKEQKEAFQKEGIPFYF